ncbi:hypothetical protein QBC44DRAFT_357562 [Cladorrhinum sp. PSN332]|nr:hypothetical protein QBC44DRAFT_357562 [Cladorrhinum sp. PSN332]
MWGSNYLKRLIGGLYLKIADQQEVEETQIQNMQFLNDANAFLEGVDQLGSTQTSLTRTQQQLASTKAIIGNLNRQLDEAITNWCGLPPPERAAAELPWPGFPGPPQSDSESSTCSFSSSYSSSYSSGSDVYGDDDQPRYVDPRELLLTNNNSNRYPGSSSNQQSRTFEPQIPSWRPQSSADFWCDPAYDPTGTFWDQNVGNCTLWTAARSGRAQHDIDYARPISPGTVRTVARDYPWSQGEGEHAGRPSKRRGVVDAREVYGEWNWV